MSHPKFSELAATALRGGGGPLTAAIERDGGGMSLRYDSILYVRQGLTG